MFLFFDTRQQDSVTRPINRSDRSYIPRSIHLCNNRIPASLGHVPAQCGPQCLPPLSAMISAPPSAIVTPIHIGIHPTPTKERRWTLRPPGGERRDDFWLVAFPFTPRVFTAALNVNRFGRDGRLSTVEGAEMGFFVSTATADESYSILTEVSRIRPSVLPTFVTAVFVINQHSKQGRVASTMEPMRDMVSSNTTDSDVVLTYIHYSRPPQGFRHAGTNVHGSPIRGPVKAAPGKVWGVGLGTEVLRFRVLEQTIGMSYGSSYGSFFGKVTHRGF